MPTGKRIEHRLVPAPKLPMGQPDVGLAEGEFLAQSPYNVVDSYNTTFAPGCFNDSLTRSLPPILWSHSGSDSPISVLGKVVDWSDSPVALMMVGQLEPLNPQYDLVHQQLVSKTIVGVSVGFIREADEPSDLADNVTTITRASLEEVSLVVTPSVPGAQVLAVRMRANRQRPRNILDDVDDVLRDRGLYR